jgi:hypothetical protein
MSRLFWLVFGKDGFFVGGRVKCPSFFVFGVLFFGGLGGYIDQSLKFSISKF